MGFKEIEIEPELNTTGLRDLLPLGTAISMLSGCGSDAPKEKIESRGIRNAIGIAEKVAYTPPSEIVYLGNASAKDVRARLQAVSARTGRASCGITLSGSGVGTDVLGREESVGMVELKVFDPRYGLSVVSLTDFPTDGMISTGKRAKVNDDYQIDGVSIHGHERPRTSNKYEPSGTFYSPEGCESFGADQYSAFTDGESDWRSPLSAIPGAYRDSLTKRYHQIRTCEGHLESNGGTLGNALAHRTQHRGSR